VPKRFFAGLFASRALIKINRVVRAVIDRCGSNPEEKDNESFKSCCCCIRVYRIRKRGHALYRAIG
jgi:hypothetical protein